MSVFSLLLAIVPLIVYSGNKNIYVGEACFTAKTRTRPQLRAPKSGRVEGVKIEHTRGGVQCHGAPATKFGCRNIGIKTYLYNSYGRIQLPLPGTKNQRGIPATFGNLIGLPNPNSHFYKFGYDNSGNTNPLILIGPAFNVKKGNQFTLDYSEGFYGRSTGDNNGQSCARVTFIYSKIDEEVPEGCSRKGKKINNFVSACRGTFNGGIGSPSSESLCSNGYDICTRSQINRNLPYAVCKNLPTGRDEFYAAAESSNGWGNCNNDGGVNNPNQGKNDIWGCASRSAAYSDRIFDNRCDNLAYRIGTAGIKPPKGWTFKGDTTEYSTAAVVNDIGGGVLCCKTPPVECPRPRGWCTHYGAKLGSIICNGVKRITCSDNNPNNFGQLTKNRYGRCGSVWPRAPRNCNVRFYAQEDEPIKLIENESVNSIKNGIYFNGINVTKLIIFVVLSMFGVFGTILGLFKLNSLCNRNKSINAKYQKVIMDSDTTDVTTDAPTDIN